MVLRVFLALLIVAGFSTPGVAQTTGHPPAQRRPGVPVLHHALVITGGTMTPVSHDGVRAFWKHGPTVSAAFLVNVDRSFAMGLALDVTRLPFDRSAFAETYPGVAAEGDAIILTTLSVMAKASLLPSMRSCPFVTASVGASRMTEELHRLVIDGARVTYFNVGGTMRLTFGLSAGVDIYLARWFALEVEAKGWYVHNDPDLGLAAAARGGVRLSF
jgi:hypothetical protein